MNAHDGLCIRCVEIADVLATYKPRAGAFVVAGDLACSYHLVAVVRRRLAETRRSTVGVGESV